MNEFMKIVNINSLRDIAQAQIYAKLNKFMWYISFCKKIFFLKRIDYMNTIFL